MSIEGTYGFVYTSANGIGIGVFTIKGELFQGTDYAGGRYDGTARENPDGSISLDIEFEVLPGMKLVQGTAPQDVPHRRRIKHSLPPEFGDGRPHELMVKRVLDDYEPYALKGFKIQINE